MKENILEELTNPRDQRRNIPVVNPYFFTRNSASKQIRVGPRTKQYGLVFDKRVVDRQIFPSYPYGYQWNRPTELDDADMDNVETLMELL